MAAHDRFDLEQCIMACWHTADDIDLLIPQLLDGEIDAEDAANLLLGIRELHNLRMRQTMDTFEQLVSHGQFDVYGDEED